MVSVKGFIIVQQKFSEFEHPDSDAGNRKFHKLFINNKSITY